MANGMDRFLNLEDVSSMIVTDGIIVQDMFAFIWKVSAAGTSESRWFRVDSHLAGRKGRHDVAREKGQPYTLSVPPPGPQSHGSIITP